MQFPVTEQLSALKELSFIFLIKVAQIEENSSRSPLAKSKLKALQKYVTDHSQFRFVTKYFSIMPVVQKKENRIVQNGL